MQETSFLVDHDEHIAIYFTPSMPLFTRHFVSQKFGRAVGNVQLDGGGNAQVEIALLEKEVAPWTCQFSEHDLGAAAPRYGVQEAALRIAIANLHHCLVKECDPADTVSVTMRPWIGDFKEHGRGSGPLGTRGATVAAERRKPGDHLEELVSCGVEMVQLEGRYAARSFLQYAHVPPSVIRRVLSNSTQRRNIDGRSGK